MRAVAAAGVLAGTVMVVAGPAWAAEPEVMRAKCQSEAADNFGLPAGEVQVKYEGQRVDGTHAVNGSFTKDGRGKTFQCSFNPQGTQIVGFVAN